MLEDEVSVVSDVVAIIGAREFGCGASRLLVLEHMRLGDGFCALGN